MRNVRPSLIKRFSALLIAVSLLFIALLFSTVYVAEEEMESISLRYWLDTEASFYERQFQRYGEQGQLPNPYHFDIYWQKVGVPPWLSTYQQPGFYEHQLGPEDKHFRVAQDPSGEGLYYIVFKDNADDFLDEYETTLHTISFVIAVVISAVLGLLMYFLFRHVTTPLKRVIQKIPQLAPNEQAFEVDANYQELADIEQALLEGKRQIDQYLTREKDFTRFAAHEIRTPLMTLQGSTELLTSSLREHISPVQQRSLKRITTAATAIDELINTFLVLGQERLADEHCQLVSVDQALQQQLQELSELQRSQGLEVQVGEPCDVVVSAPKAFVYVLIKNLLKNALSYADTQVEVSLTDNHLRIINDIEGNNDSGNYGYGYGLIIVQRICEKLGWDYQMTSSAELFSVTIGFTAIRR